MLQRQLSYKTWRSATVIIWWAKKINVKIDPAGFFQGPLIHFFGCKRQMSKNRIKADGINTQKINWDWNIKKYFCAATTRENCPLNYYYISNFECNIIFLYRKQRKSIKKWVKKNISSSRRSLCGSQTYRVLVALRICMYHGIYAKGNNII